MSRIVGVIDPQPPDPLVQAAFASDISRTGKIMPATRAWALVPQVYDAFTRMSEAQHKLNGVPAEVKALATLLAYMRVGCVACLDFGSVAARRQGATEDKLMALQQYETSHLFSEPERAALRLAEAMTRTPAQVASEAFEALQPFYDEAQVMELIIHIATANLRARMGCALDLVPEGFSEGQYCVLPARERQQN